MDKKIDIDRRMILTHIGAEDRMKVYAELRRYADRYLKVGLAILFIFVAVASLGVWLIGKDLDWSRGYIEGAFVIMLFDIIWNYRTKGKDWRAPTQEEIEELGDTIE